MQWIYVEVESEPRPKGSVSAFPIKRAGGRIGTVVVHSKKSKEFEAEIRKAVENSPKLPGAVSVDLWIFLSKPKSVKRLYPWVKPDIDKLVRAVLDGLDKQWEDDARVVDLEVHKRYAKDKYPPGVWIYVEPKVETELGLSMEEEILDVIRAQRQMASILRAGPDEL